MEFKRVLDLRTAINAKSHFLFGPRGVGKTTLIRETLAADYQVISGGFECYPIEEFLIALSESEFN